MNGVVDATMVRGFELHLSVVWLNASYRIIPTWKGDCSSPTNIWVWVWVQQEPGAKMGWHVGKEPVTGERAPMHCQLQLLEGHFRGLLHVAYRCKPAVKIPTPSSSYRLIFPRRAKQFPLCIRAMTSWLEKWLIIIFQQFHGPASWTKVKLEIIDGIEEKDSKTKQDR